MLRRIFATGGFQRRFAVNPGFFASRRGLGYDDCYFGGGCPLKATLIDSTDSQDQLVRGLAHRMNNILTLFHGYLSMLMDNPKLDTPTREALEKIHNGAAAAADLVDRTSALVRPTTSVWRAIDLNAFVGMLHQSFEKFCGPRTKLHVAMPAEISPIHGDAGRVKTALVELVKNACEATFANGGNVWVDLSEETQAKAVGGRAKWISFSVTDDGPGVAPEMRERIFTPFFSTKKKLNAAGLGLSVVTGVARQHEGAITLDSTADRTVFTLRLPASNP